MSIDHQQVPTEVMTFITASEPTPSESEIRAKARDAKKKLTDEYLAIWRSLNLVDNLVAVYAPDPSWQWGWVVEQPTQTVPPPAVTSGRAARVLELASAMVRQGNSTVTSRAIASQLMAEGEEGKLRDLATGVGNVLARAPGWRRVRPGEYAPAAEGEASS